MRSTARVFGGVAASGFPTFRVDQLVRPLPQRGPALIQLAAERAGALKLVEVDVDAAPALAKRFAVQSVPTLVLLNQGRILARQSGVPPVTCCVGGSMTHPPTQRAPQHRLGD
ncbi:thioredoxin family protein [Mycobacterium xenopi]|uniref:thioredoxin family protein n=1 Tax=Mycobacterium xenopi TaxID=1789 RepID=UPI001E598DF3|nr:thioredoxin family protein [Mycobacterium xenopi]MDA3637924.1 thioredoxin family protein [Mycobacterium xenopi]MDA3655993.1 thioredoxin family protein [Mycobacterium xenopi]MDA3660689.1 thioredoxin family protein [Mycobacterium xenopi]